MATVLFKGWNYGLQKISLTKIFQLKTGLTFKEAKEKTEFLSGRKTFLLKLKVLNKQQNW